MKKTWFFWLFLLAASAASFAADPANNQIFIEGHANNSEQLDFFMGNFAMEAESLRFTLAEKKEDAGYTFKFDVIPNVIEYSDGTKLWPAPGEKEWVIQISFTRNEDNTELVSFGFEFTDLMEMNMFNHTLFLNATADISPYSESGFAGGGGGPEDHEWRNKWVYLRVSAEWPVTFYVVNTDNLYKGAIYQGPWDKTDPNSAPPYYMSPIGSKVMGAPRVSIGAEVQFLDFLSVEPKLQVGLENLNDTYFISMAAGANIKAPLKFMGNIMLEPYGSVMFPLFLPLSIPFLDTSEIFDSFPFLGFGGGIQVGLKGGKSGSIFFDVNFMYYLGDVKVYNQFTYPDILSPDDKTQPDLIHYQRYVLGLGVGYKFGLIDRK